MCCIFQTASYMSQNTQRHAPADTTFAEGAERRRYARGASLSQTAPTPSQLTQRATERASRLRQINSTKKSLNWIRQTSACELFVDIWRHSFENRRGFMILPPGVLNLREARNPLSSLYRWIADISTTFRACSWRCSLVHFAKSDGTFVNQFDGGLVGDEFVVLMPIPQKPILPICRCVCKAMCLPTLSWRSMLFFHLGHPL